MKIAFCLLLILNSYLVSAGLPEEDFAVDLTRESFRDGKKPKEADLYLTFQWVCGTYGTSVGTMTGNPGITLGEVHFIREGSTLINRTGYFPGRAPLVSSQNELSSYTLNEAGEVTSYYFIRKNHDGLLVERAVVASSPLVPAIAAPELHAVSYSYCLPFDYDSKAPKIMNRPWGDVWSND